MSNQPRVISSSRGAAILGLSPWSTPFEIFQLIMEERVPGWNAAHGYTLPEFDDINRFPSAKKYSSYAGLVPWVQNSNQTIRHGRITKRGPEELRTAIVQLVLGMRRCKKTLSWRLMERYSVMKETKGSGKSIIATARKVSKIIWCMLSSGEEFNPWLMIDKRLRAKADAMRINPGKSA